MSKTIENEPISPQEIKNRDWSLESGYSDPKTFRGLTKREHFAAMAMQGMITSLTGNSDVAISLRKMSDEKGVKPGVYIANCSVEFADALIDALNK